MTGDPRDMYPWDQAAGSGGWNEVELTPIAAPEGSPKAHIRRVGRWSYEVWVTHGILQWGPNGAPWRVYGAKRAARSAFRHLRRYIDEEQRREVSRRTQRTIRPEDLP